MNFRGSIRKLSIVDRVISVSKKVVLPGFDQQSLYVISKFLMHGLNQRAITTRAYAVAFNFLLGLFPGIIFMFSLIPYFPIENIDDQLLMQLKLILPTDAYNLLEQTIIDLVSKPRGGLLSFGFFMMLYFSTTGINTLIDTFHESAFIKERRSYLKQKIVAIGLVIILFLLLLTAISLVVFGQYALAYASEMNWFATSRNYYLLKTLNWVTIVGLFYFAISAMYFLGPSGIRRWNFFSAGSSLATMLMIGTAIGFAYYIDNFAQYNKFYGSLGTIIVIMLWTFLNALILLLGFELNATIKYDKDVGIKSNS